jgi:hypothetical protein
MTNKTIAKIATAAVTFALLASFRGVFPELYRYLRIRRM